MRVKNEFRLGSVSQKNREVCESGDLEDNAEDWQSIYSWDMSQAFSGLK